MTLAAGSRILVVGGGIAGLAAARALARVGFAPEIVEREPSPGAGTGIYLPGNAVRALRVLGLGAEVAERAVEIPRQRFLDHRGRLLADVDVSQLWAGVAPCLALHRAELHDVLHRGAGGAPIRVGVTLDRLAQRDQKVTAELSDGTQGEYDLVIGADGIHSTVRRLAFGGAPARPLGQLASRFVAACPREVTTWSLMLGRRTALLMLPIGHGRAYYYCDVDAEPGADRSLETPAELLAEFAEPAQAILESIGVVHVSAIEEVVLDSWIHGNVVLIGDAAHATSPNMAEGAAMALEDALVLASSLAEAAPLPRLLAAFESRRRPRTDWVRAQTHRRDRTRNLPPVVRNLILRTVGPRIFRANYAPLFADV